MFVKIRVYLWAKPSLFPPSPIVMWTVPQGSNLPLLIRFWGTKHKKLNSKRHRVMYKCLGSLCIPSVHKHAHDQQVLDPHWQRKAGVQWQPSYHHLHLDEPCYYYTKEHGTARSAKVSLCGPPLKDRPMEKEWQEIRIKTDCLSFHTNYWLGRKRFK